MHSATTAPIKQLEIAPQVSGSDSECAKAIGARIKLARVRLGLRQLDVGTMLHVTRQTVSSWERGDYMPDAVVARRLCVAIAVSPDWLMGWC